MRALVAASSLAAAADGATWYTSPTGSDSADGSEATPFRTITRCSQAMESSNTSEAAVCVVGPGTYRETVSVGRSAAGPRSFVGAGPSAATVSGLEPVSGDWEQQGTCTWALRMQPDAPDFQQLFYGGEMMVEARWPNIDVSKGVADSILDRATWAPTGKGSVYGSITHPGLASANFSWKGGLATLNVAHQWNTWTREVTSHEVGSDSFAYPKDLPGLAGYTDPTGAYFGECVRSRSTGKCNQFFLSGKLEAMDAPGEWFHDTAAHVLHFMTPDCERPAKTVEVKARDFAFDVEAGASRVTVAGMTVKGATVSMARCDFCSLSGLDLVYPAYNREVPELSVNSSKVASTLVHGTNNTVSNVSLRYSNNNGLSVSGNGTRVENCLVSKVDWMGSLTYRPLGASGTGIVITKSTVEYFGNAGVVVNIPNTPAASTQPPPPGVPQPVPKPMAGRHLEVSYTHIHHGGLVGLDTALLYTGGWQSAGLHWHHNWVHDAVEKCLRCDDQGANMTVHNNVVYNCGVPPVDATTSSVAGIGVILKGNGHVVYSNTVFGANYTELCMPACRSPLKKFRKQYPLEVQNTASQVFNTAARRDLGFPCSCRNKTHDLHNPGGNTTGMYGGSALGLQDPANFDFRPSNGSPLVDAGVVFPPYTDGFVGAAPDVGAYERGGVWWKAGCSGLPGCLR
eukprot:TRINITY_DN6134_c0_g1_i1.p1 TRINITY_DN6134_c0_g1~~TRINITY_DN6134_c0_g1_i1.p1  ORF type:complete len:682 (+),score=158.36 TRINITY_DN6134_c0_g1_i1:78-2123(+)